MTPQTQFTFDGQGVVLANRKDVVCRDVHPDYVNLVISAPSLYAALKLCKTWFECGTEAGRETVKREIDKVLDLGSSTPR